MLEAEYYGWPIAQALEDSGIGISGCDISKRLVDEAKKTLKTNDIYVGDLNNINLTDKYDVVYCLRTSWCMPNLNSVWKR